MTLRFRTLLWVLTVEEWRLHSHLFGGRRFAAFPAVVAAVSVGTSVFFVAVGVDPSSVVAGLHLVVGLLGLQVGTVGLLGRDALEDLLGETTLLVFSARTLPVEPKRLLVAFLLKDVGYYTGLFVLPLLAGLVPFVADGAFSVSWLLAAVATATATFVGGVAASFALVGTYTRSKSAAVALAVGGAGVIAVGRETVVSLSPYGLLSGGSVAGVLSSVLLPVGLMVVGITLFRFERHDTVRNTTNRFGPIRRLLGDDDGVVTKSVLEIHRSSGGVLKILFSQGIVLGLAVALLIGVPRLVPVEFDPGLTAGAVLGAGTFTTYNWLCRFDSAEFYGRYPVSMPSVFRAKLLAFCLLALPTGLAFVGFVGIVFGTGVIVGGIVFLTLSLYVFGLTAFLAGLEPTELLFDTPVFVGFSAAVMVVVVPLVVAAIARPLAPTGTAVGAICLSTAAGVAGLWLTRRAGGRWQDRALNR
ncbi:MAG: hypothetical protein PPP58_06295 [Natronomonas sp.]